MTARIWRISEFADLSGEGGLAAPGRWNEKGYPIVYCTDHPSTALLEVLVHFSAMGLPKTYQLLEISVPSSISIRVPQIPDSWRKNVSITREIWTRFYRQNHACLMRVPSVVMPKAENYLLNPSHPDAASIRIAETWRYPFDSRLLA